MAGKKGMKHYPPAIKAEIIERYKAGESVCAISREYGISRWAISNWCGLTTKPMQVATKRKGRPRKYPITNQREMELEIKRLKMEVDLLRSFLQAAGRG
jgi:transposase-like protein